MVLKRFFRLKTTPFYFDYRVQASKNIKKTHFCTLYQIRPFRYLKISNSFLIFVKKFDFVSFLKIFVLFKPVEVN